MLQVVRASTLSNNAVTTKELNYLLRFLAPAACRNPDIFAGKNKGKQRRIGTETKNLQEKRVGM